MPKPRLVSSQLLSLHSDWLSDMVGKYFELASDGFRPGDCYYTKTWDSTAQAWRDSGGRVVVDNLWETPVSVPGCYVLQHPAWFWYNESLWYQHLGYNTYVRSPAVSRRALMPMRLQRTHRDYMLKLLGSDLDQLLWSYQSAGRHLPGDYDPESWNSQRYFNPEWYDTTEFSLVVETWVTASTPFVTEKTFKPAAFWHPFLCLGCQHSLKYLQELGFETFSNLWDESYDNLPVWIDRARAIADIVKTWSGNVDTPETREKTAHNHARFFDAELVRDRIRTEILEPLLEYATTT